MKQAIGLAVIAAGVLVVWAGITNAGGHDKDGNPIPSLGQTVGNILRGGHPAHA